MFRPDKLQRSNELQINVFTVHESGGKLEIGQSVNIDVDCCVLKVGRYEEVILIKYLCSFYF